GTLQSELHKYARSKGEQGPTVQTKPRCVRLQYTKSFHFDVVPATVDAKIGGTAIVVPDRELTRWRPNNPLLYQRWFEERCIVHRSVMAEARCQAPLPDNAGVRDKAPLKIAVQLVKRRRDRWYASRRRDNDAPPSIVVTTLAAEH